MYIDHGPTVIRLKANKSQMKYYVTTIELIFIVVIGLQLLELFVYQDLISLLCLQ